MLISEGAFAQACPRRSFAIVSIVLLIVLSGLLAFGVNAQRLVETEHSQGRDNPLPTLCMVDWNALLSPRLRIASVVHVPFTVKYRNGPGGPNARFHVVVVITLEQGRSPPTASTADMCALVFLNRKIATMPLVQKIAHCPIGARGRSALIRARPKIKLLVHMSDTDPFAITVSLVAKNADT
jgi:hypothetical protein